MNVQVLNAPMIYGGLFASMAAGYYMYKNGMRKLNIEVSTGSLKVAVMVILSPGFIKLSASFVEMLSVGEVVSTVNEIFCEPAT